MTAADGLAMESVDGAVIEDVSITNITMRDLMGAPIFLRLGARMRGPENVPVGDAAARDSEQHNLRERRYFAAHLLDSCGDSGPSD